MMNPTSPLRRHRWWMVAAAGLFIIAWLAWAPGDGEPHADQQQRSEPDRAAVLDENVVFACTARVEGASETIEVGAGLDGVIAELRVHDGDRVRAGDVLAVIDRRELGAELGGAKSAAAPPSRTPRRARTRR